MDEEEIMDEIRSVFQDSFITFLSFDILQHGGGRLKSLVVPSLSSSYTWTASAVAGSSKSPIYILSHNDDLVAAMETSERDLPEVTFAKKKETHEPIVIDDQPAEIQVPVCKMDTNPNYESYIDLVNDSDPLESYSPTPPLTSPLTPGDKSDLPLDSLLISHQSRILSSNLDDCFRLTVRRKHIFQDTLHRLKSNIDLTKHLRINFVGEPAIDDGGPRREYLRLLLGVVASNSSLFCGDVERHFLRHNVIELSRKTYYNVGQMISMSLMHGGPAPTFFAEPVLKYILYGLDKVTVCIEDVQEAELKAKLLKLEGAENIDQFKEILSSDEYDFRYECGVSKAVCNIEESDRDTIISSLCLHSLILMSKAELDQLIDGLKCLEILELLRSNPCVSHKLFVRSTANILTVEYIYDLFSPSLSSVMSNTRDKEEAQLFNWSNFLQLISDSNNKVTVVSPSDGEEHEIFISLSHILVFGTGADREPPMGFVPSPKIDFRESKYLTANTCTNTINLPIMYMDCIEFNYYAAFSIANSLGFGQL